MCCYLIKLSHGLLNGLFWIDICIYIYIYIEEKLTSLCKTLFSIFLERNYLVMKLFPFISFCFGFHLEVTWPHHVIYLLPRGKRLHSRKPLFFVCKEKQHFFENSFYHVFITEIVIATPWSPLITFFIVPFFGRSYISEHFQYSPISNGFILLINVHAVIFFVNFYVWFSLFFLVSDLLVVIYKCSVG